jgi:hypothetical protein
MQIFNQKVINIKTGASVNNLPQFYLDYRITFSKNFNFSLERSN